MWCKVKINNREWNLVQEQLLQGIISCTWASWKWVVDAHGVSFCKFLYLDFPFNNYELSSFVTWPPRSGALLVLDSWPLWLGSHEVHVVATLPRESVRMRLTLPKWGFGSPPRLPKLQSSIVRVKTPCIQMFFISVETYQSVDVENGLAWTIWTSAAYVMPKRKVESQIGSLTPDH
jgi:hypothetical protein